MPSKGEFFFLRRFHSNPRFKREMRDSNKDRAEELVTEAERMRDRGTTDVDAWVDRIALDRIGLDWIGLGWVRLG